MKSEDVGSLPIVEDDRLVGVVTDRDLAIRVVAEGTQRGHDRRRDRLEGRRHRRPAAVLEEAARLMAEHQVRRLPVCEEDGKLVGMLAQADVAQSGPRHADRRDGAADLAVERALESSRARRARETSPPALSVGCRHSPHRPMEMTMAAAVYKGPFGREQAERLLWRAGFGPRRARLRTREARPRRRRSLADASEGREVRRPGAARRQGPPARSGRRLGSRPPLVARPDGAHLPPARRADDARLARLVRDLARRRRLAEADARAEQAPAQPLARIVRQAADARSRATRRCCSGSRAPRTRSGRRTRTTRAS